MTLDGGSFSTEHESATLGGTVRRFDYFGELAHFGSANDLPNTATATRRSPAGRRRRRPQHRRQRHLPVDRPNATSRPTASASSAPRTIFSRPTDRASSALASQTQINQKWQASVSRGAQRPARELRQPERSAGRWCGVAFGPVGFGRVVTITGGNGYSATGQGELDFGVFQQQQPIRSTRQGIYAQTTYEPHRNFSCPAAAMSSADRAFPSASIFGDSQRDPRQQRAVARGARTLADRRQHHGGLGHARIEGLRRATRRVSPPPRTCGPRMPTGSGGIRGSR